jgi:hypothetical protein
MNDHSELGFLSYKSELQVQETFLNEYECMVNFVMIAIQNSRIRADQINKGFLRFLANKKDILYALNINFTIPSSGSLSQRMQQVNDQIDQLDAKEKMIFEKLKLLYENEKLSGKSMADAAKQDDIKRQEERSKISDEVSKKKQEDLERLQV